MSQDDDVRDDLDLFLEEQLKDERFKGAYEDAAARAALLRSLTSRRSDQSISQSAVARLMGTTQSAVSDLENGSTDPRLSTLQRYARAVGCRLDVLVKDSPVRWLPGSVREEVAVNPVRVAAGDSGNDWQVRASHTHIRVASVSATFAGKDTPLA